MNQIDFLIIYEVKSREIENLCLLKYELENRGYSVEIINTWYYLDKPIPNYYPEVIISFALYNDNTFKFISTFSKQVKKIVNMHWEQVGCLYEESDSKSLFYLKGIAKQATNVCWGDKTYNRLKNECGIEDKNLLLSGHITLDFLRDNFSDYYHKKEFIMNKYDIPKGKKIYLFISSFSYVNLPESIAKQSDFSSKDLQEFISISNKSQSEIVSWIERYIQNNDDVIFIYRPHPAESESESISNIAKKYSGFKVISDYSVKQWIIISDVVYTWYSTSIAEVYYSKKPCYILRPFHVPEKRELGIYKGATFIKEYIEFEESINKDEYFFPIRQDKMNIYYYVDYQEPTYIKICNKLEEILNSDDYLLTKLKKEQRISKFQKIKTYIYISKIMKSIDFMSDRININFSYFAKKKMLNDVTKAYTKEMTMKNYVSKDEIIMIQKRISTLLESQS